MHMNIPMNPRGFRPGRAGAAVSLIAACLLGACDKGGDSTGADAEPIAATGRNAVADDQQSAHFAAVNGHLDLGGIVYGYLDIDGDVEKLAGFLQKSLDEIKQQAGDEMPAAVKNLDIASVVEELGLAGIEALGTSTVKIGDLYRNKGYVHIPAGREGLLKILGGEATPFVAAELAPVETDLVWEMELDIKAGYEMVTRIVGKIGGPEAAAELENAVSEQIPQLGMTPHDVLSKLDTRITVIGRLHPDKPLEIPDAPTSIPSFDLLVALDDTGWLFDTIVGRMKQEVPADQQAEMIESGDGFEKLKLPPVPSPDMVIARPVIYHDKASKRVLIASTQAFLDECLGDGDRLAASEVYQKATEGLPEEGNALSYTSPQFVKEFRRILTESMAGAVDSPAGNAAGVTGSPASFMMGRLKALFDVMLPDSEHGTAGVSANLPEGIYSVSNSPVSIKEAVVLGGMVGIGGGIAGFTAARLRTSPPDVELRIPTIEEAVPAVPAAEESPFPPAEGVPAPDAVPSPIDPTDPADPTDPTELPDDAAAALDAAAEAAAGGAPARRIKPGITPP